MPAMKETRLMAILGSGGHTKEMLSLMSNLGPQYNPRYYIIANTDQISKDKVKEFESEGKGKGQYKIYRIPRSREVKQSWLTTVWTTLFSIIYAIPLVFSINPNLILCNGPGTCIPLCIAGFLLKILKCGRTKIIYVESMCRVQTLSLSAKMLLYFADHILVQWKTLQEKYPKTEYIGRIV